MKCLNKLAVGLFALIASSPILADFKSFEAPIDESRWEFNGNPLSCQLSHQVPFYGTALFEKNAGPNQLLMFNLSYQREPISPNTIAQVNAIKASWHPKQTSKKLGEVKLNSSQTIITNQQKASWSLLNELESGRFPTFVYQKYSDKTNRISVALSSVGFSQEYSKFLNCLSTLVPHKLNELKQMTLYFDFDKSLINGPYQQKLESLAAYIKYDPSVEIVFISGHTDSKGPQSYNRKLSQRRINSIKKVLSQYDVEESRFKTFSYGEKRPAATNRTAKGRAKNRRVYIRVMQQ